MKINAKTRLFGLVGTPIRHSFSPLMHNNFFERKKIDAVYTCFEMEPEDFRHIKRSMKTLGVCGFNVTVPYKEKIIKYLDEIDTEAAIIGAVNTVTVVDGRFKGYNTDGAGFIASLKERAGFDPQGKYAVIIGCGGASRALAAYLLKEKISFLGLCDVNKKAALKLKNELSEHYGPSCIYVYDDSSQIDLNGVDMLINATGLGRKASDPEVIEHKKLHKDLFVYDLIYAVDSAIIKAARKKGCRTMNGLWMLIYQGLKAQEIWQKKKFPGAEKILLEGIK